MKPLHIDDVEVQDVAEDAARAACAVLDETFHGKDNGGITSNFQGLLAKVIAEMLSGADPHDVATTHSTELPALVLTNRSFGKPSTVNDGSGFIIERANDGLVLDAEEQGFIPADSDRIDPYTSFDAAVRGAMKYLRQTGSNADAEGLSVVLYSALRMAEAA